MKKAAIAAVVLLIGVGGYMLWPKHSQGQNGGVPGGAAPAVEVVVQTIKAEDIDLFQDLPGRTQAFKVAEIRPQVNGIIIKRLFEEGSDIEEGQQLYQIDPAPYQAAYDSALADLQKAEANIKSTQAKQARYTELVKVGGVSKQEFDDTAAALAQSEADVAIAKAAVTTAKINLDYTKVFSPIAGRIGKSSVTEGALVTANQAAPLAVVQQLDKIYVDVTQSISDLRKMKKTFGESTAQLSATLTIEGETEPYSEKGLLQFADVTVDQGTGTVQLRILFENPKIDLLPGMFVKARVTQGQADAAILAPQKAVTRNADGSTTIWLVDAENKANVHPVTVSRVVGDQWLVSSGLKSGDRIVVEGLPKLGPGTLVNPVEKTAGPQIPPEQPAAQK
ncbi:MAG: efflux transporter periplasmic adaptor subunit [Micavibrio aeruginosavorus]|uniref:Efflux transporter periplasmic adaptor subunit n=1 Tax=Micavibrio aeruginosavorus TaxID=349221 RepID=A0A2W5A748_9BACT|nr:MAG: efflux transporter periplasmic adaptor subunit [Micavibrio aeruginosavorus]